MLINIKSFISQMNAGNKFFCKFSILLLVLISLGSCQKLSEPFSPSIPEDNSILDGPVEGLNSAQKLEFLLGDVAFNDEVFTASTGLGPCFVASSCGTCHAGDGKGHPFSSLIRFGQKDTLGNQFNHSGGPQLQNRAIPGYQSEVIPVGASFSTFMPPAITGLGFLEAISDAQILENADPEDANGDGISGRPNYIPAPWYFQPLPHHNQLNGKYIGRFGKKAGSISLLHQTAKAYNQDMGVTSIYETKDPCSGLDGDPEVLTKSVQAVVFYLQTLKAPVQRNVTDPEIEAGKKLFIEIGCGSCHTPRFKTGANAIEALSHKEFYPYSDLLLHDMGAGLDDGYTEGMANTSEWRTPPLWGHGLSKNSQGGQVFLMHDGRAKSNVQAILMHGGEAEKSRNQFHALTSLAQNQIIQFLESL